MLPSLLVYFLFIRPTIIPIGTPNPNQQNNKVQYQGNPCSIPATPSSPSIKPKITNPKTGLNNLCGKNVTLYKQQRHLSQRELADSLQLLGLDVDKNAIQRIECGKRFVTDIEFIYIIKALDVTFNDLIQPFSPE